MPLKDEEFFIPFTIVSATCLCFLCVVATVVPIVIIVYSVVH